jgi:hypothetical protein
MEKIERIMMCKIPREEDRLQALEQYKLLKRAAMKVLAPLLRSQLLSIQLLSNDSITILQKLSIIACF